MNVQAWGSEKEENVAADRVLDTFFDLSNDAAYYVAIGKTTGENPFLPSWRLIGGYWQWGRKRPDPGQWYNTNTSDFVHGPIGLSGYESHSGAISG